MDLRWTEAEVRLREDLRAYVAEHRRPDWSSLLRDMPEPEDQDAVREFCTGLAQQDLLVPQWPVEYGGRGAPRWSQIVISEEMWRAGEPRGSQYMNVNWVGPAIMSLGTEEQRLEHLQQIGSGDAFWCQGFSEPDAGSDLAALRTSAVRDGDEYVINGQKIWTSYAHTAGWCFLLARTANTENPRKGISIFLVPMDVDGIEVREIPSLGLPHLLHEVFFDGVRVPVGNRLGPENEGWSIIRTLLANERVQNATHTEVEGLLERLVDEADGSGAEPSPEEFESLGRAHAAMEASKILNYVAVQAWVDDSEDYAKLAAVYRASSAEMLSSAYEAYVDVRGPDGLVEVSGGDYQLVRTIISSVGGGSLEMQLNGVATQVLGLPRS